MSPSIMLVKNIHIQSLILFKFCVIVVFDVETALENAKLAILVRQELQIIFVLGTDKEIFLWGKVSCILKKTKMSFI